MELRRHFLRANHACEGDGGAGPEMGSALEVAQQSPAAVSANLGEEGESICLPGVEAQAFFIFNK